MNQLMLEAIIARCRLRQAEGDHPTRPALSVEQLEDAVIQLADSLARLTLGHRTAVPEYESRQFPIRMSYAAYEHAPQGVPLLLPSCPCGKDRECPVNLARGEKRYGCPCGDDACDCPRAAHFNQVTAVSARWQSTTREGIK